MLTRGSKPMQAYELPPQSATLATLSYHSSFYLKPHATTLFTPCP